MTVPLPDRAVRVVFCGAVVELVDSGGWVPVPAPRRTRKWVVVIAGVPVAWCWTHPGAQRRRRAVGRVASVVGLDVRVQRRRVGP